MNIFVGNLSYDTQDNELRAAFAPFGNVASARVATDRETGRSRGFGFVEMPSQSEAETAITALNGTQLQSRTITVNESRPREDRPGGGNRQGSYSNNRGGGGGGGNRW